MNNILKHLQWRDEFDALKKEEDLYKKSLYLVKWLFENKTDKDDKPYINHLLRVSSKMTTLDGKVAALLHDVVEDIEGVTFDDLIDIGIPYNIIKVLKLVTKKPHENNLTKEEKLLLYNEEINNIIKSNNMLAIELKYSDMSDNYNKERLNKLDSTTREWLEKKYSNNIKKLEKRLENK